MDIKKIIREEIVMREQELRHHTIPELAQIASRQTTYPVEIMEKMLVNAYQQGGDAGVEKVFAEMVGVQIQTLRQGRYVFANLGGGGEAQRFVAEIQDNARHCPDEMPS